uniref:Uncharacterized protein n=2 Tax=Populus trichocarpa TaxID=3694 RepID=A0A2K1Y0U8_POPTR
MKRNISHPVSLLRNMTTAFRKLVLYSHKSIDPLAVRGAELNLLTYSIISFDNNVLNELNESLDDHGQLVFPFVSNNWSWLIYFHVRNIFR